MKFQLTIVSGCIAIIAINISGNAAGPNKPSAPAASAAPVPRLMPDSAFSDYQPFREEKVLPWKESNQVVADHPGMRAMGSMGGMKSMGGMDAKSDNAAKGKEGAAGHDMGSMKGMSGMGSTSGDAAQGKEGASGHNMAAMKGMPGMESRSGQAPKGTGHDMGSMNNMPGVQAKAGGIPNGKEASAGDGKPPMKGMSEKSMSTMNMPAATSSRENHSAMAMAKPATAADGAEPARTAAVSGTALVQGVDKPNGKLKLAHDPISALGWPKMTMFFRLKDSALADRVKEGDKIEFSLEKSASGYIISDLKKSAPSR